MTPPWTRRQILVLGKGGVGRSTVAAAVAIAAGRAGLRVALVEVNGASSLAERFGVTPRQAAQRVADGVDLRSLTSAGCLSEYVADRLRIAPIAARLFRGARLSAWLDGLPGVTDLLHHGKIHSLVDPDRGPAYDVVVVDAPATGHGVQFLDTPEALCEMTRLGPLHDEARRIADRLRDPAHTAALIVTLPEPLPAAEAIDLLAAMGPHRAVVEAILVDQVVANPLPDGVPWEALAATLSPGLVAAGGRRLRQVRAQAGVIAQLAVAAPGVRVCALPRVEMDPPGRRRLADALARGLA